MPKDMNEWMRRQEQRISILERRRGVSDALSQWARLATAEVPITDSRFRTYNSDTIPNVARRGNVVEFFGALGSDSVMTTATIAGVMQIPEGYRPRGSYSRIGIYQGSGTNRWDLVVNEAAAGGSASGRVDVGRYAPGSSATNTWMPFTMMWFTDEDWPA